MELTEKWFYLLLGIGSFFSILHYLANHSFRNWWMLSLIHNEHWEVLTINPYNLMSHVSDFIMSSCLKGKALYCSLTSTSLPFILFSANKSRCKFWYFPCLPLTPRKSPALLSSAWSALAYVHFFPLPLPLLWLRPSFLYGVVATSLSVSRVPVQF